MMIITMSNTDMLDFWSARTVEDEMGAGRV